MAHWIFSTSGKGGAALFGELLKCKKYFGFSAVAGTWHSNLVHTIATVKAVARPQAEQTAKHT